MSTFRAYALQYCNRLPSVSESYSSPVTADYSPILNDKLIDQKGVYWGGDGCVIEHLKAKRFNNQ